MCRMRQMVDASTFTSLNASYLFSSARVGKTVYEEKMDRNLVDDGNFERATRWNENEAFVIFLAFYAQPR